MDLELTVNFESGTPGTVVDQDPREEIVSLPALRCLALGSTNRAGLLTAAFLEHLKLPPSANTFLIYNSDDYCPPEELPDLNELFRRIADPKFHGGTSFRTCCIIQNPSQPTNELQGEEDNAGYSHNVIFVLWPTHYSLQELDMLPEETLTPGKLAIMFEGPCSWSHDALFQAALATPLLSHVSALMVRASQYSHETWQRFACLANVTQLSVSSHALAYSFVKTLACPAPPVHLLFPRLKRLALRGIHWREGLPEPGLDNSPFSQRCHDALSARLAQGIPLQNMIFGSPEDLPGAHIQYLEIAGLVETTEQYLSGDSKEDEEEKEGKEKDEHMYCPSWG